MQIAKQVRQFKAKADKAKMIWEHYVGRRRTDALEPQWIHPAYELMRDYEKLQAKALADQIIESHEFEDGEVVYAIPGCPQSPARVMHDGWKLGTPTWIFMGRALPHNYCQRFNDDLVIVGRRMPDRLFPCPVPDTVYMAYQLSEPLGMTVLTANCFGPYTSLEELKAAIRSG